MTVVRVKKNANYTSMANFHLRDKNLSLKTIGLLSIILSLPEDWDYTVEGLALICKDGLHAVRNALIEMEENGYLVRERFRDSKGHLGGAEYTIYEDPLHDNPALRNPTSDKPIFENQMMENPIDEKTALEKHTQLSKDKQNKEQPSKDKPSCAYLHTSREKEDDHHRRSFFRKIAELIGQPLSGAQRMTCALWLEQQMDPEMILLAVKDNLFRKDRFDMKYVKETLERWASEGVTTPLQARNRILDNHVANVKAMAAEIGYKNGNEDLVDKIVFGNEAADLQSTRDYMIKLFHEGRFSDLLTWASTTYHKEILEYLPEEVSAFIQRNIA